MGDQKPKRALTEAERALLRIIVREAIRRRRQKKAPSTPKAA